MFVSIKFRGGAMKSLSKTILATGAAVVSFAAISSPASAAVITAWDWSVNTQFSAAVWEDRGPGTGNPGNGITNAAGATGSEGVFQDASTISWGGDGNFNVPNGNRSGLTLDLPNTVSSPPNPPVITDGGPSVATSSITHWNNPVDLELDFLDKASLDTTLTLAPNGGGAALPPLNLSFSVDFKETPNNVSAGSCAVQPNTGPCPDIFVLSPGTPFSQQFIIGQITYQVDIVTLVGSIADLSDAACTEAGAALGCKGFTTEENTTTNVQFGFQISQVPEPGTLSLMGLGLVGGAVLRRRKRVA